MSNVVRVDFTRKLVLGNTVMDPFHEHYVERETLSAFERAKQSTLARFGSEGLPNFLTKAWASKRMHSEPYAFGDVGNVCWGTEKMKWSKVGKWNRPYPFAMPIHESISEIGKAVHLGGTDPLMWMDLKYLVTHEHIQKRRGNKLVINTRSDLIAHDKYLSVLDKEHHEIYIHVNHFTSDVTRLLEPGCPSVKRRLTAYEKLTNLGFKVFLVLDQLGCTVPKCWIDQGLRLPSIRNINRIKIENEQMKIISTATGAWLPGLNK